MTSTLTVNLLCQGLYLCRTSSVEGCPLLYVHHCHRTSSVTGLPLFQAPGSSPLSQDVYYTSRTSNVAGPQLTLDLHSPITLTIKEPPLSQDLHCFRTSNVGATALPQGQDLQCSKTSIVTGPPLSQDINSFSK